MVSKGHQRRSRSQWLRRGIFLFLTSLFFAYSALVYDVGTGGERNEALATSEEQRGKMVWQEQNCQACHQIYGLGGYLGPDLTDVMSREGKGESWVRAMLQSGPQAMPAFELPEQDIAALVSFLAAVDESGNFPEKNLTINWWGSFEM